MKKVRNVRKDKGVPKKPIATILTGHIVSSEGHFEGIRNVDWYVHLWKVNKPKKKEILNSIHFYLTQYIYVNLLETVGSNRVETSESRCSLMGWTINFHSFSFLFSFSKIPFFCKMFFKLSLMSSWNLKSTLVGIVAITQNHTTFFPSPFVTFWSTMWTSYPFASHFKTVFTLMSKSCCSILFRITKCFVAVSCCLTFFPVKVTEC